MVNRDSSNLLTSGYGILTDEDLAINAWSGVGKRWQCFPVHAVKPEMRIWEDSDDINLIHQDFKLCSLQIRAVRNEELQIFGERRAYGIGRCHEFMKNWEMLIQGESFVCINGEREFMGEEIDGNIKKLIRHWTWDKIKTKKGCFGYFGRECELSYWEDRGYPSLRKLKSN